MLSHGIEFAKYGVQTTFYWFFEDVTATDAPFTGVAPVTADIFISKDGGAPATATNAMTAIGNGIYSHVLTATEMQATRLSISVYDQTASEIYKPACRVILTKLQLGQIDVDATQIGNASALNLLGGGTGNGLRAKGGTTGGGADLSAGGYFEGGTGINADGLRIQGTLAGHGMSSVGGLTGYGIVGSGGATSGGGISAFAAAGNSVGFTASGFGTGAAATFTGGATGNGITTTGGATSGDGLVASNTGGNSNGITASGRGTGKGLNVTHATDNSLMTNIFDTLEGTEPTAAIGSNATFKQIFQNLKRRFFNLVTQTSSVQTMFRDDSVTSLQTMACSNDGTTQSKGKAS